MVGKFRLSNFQCKMLTKYSILKFPATKYSALSAEQIKRKANKRQKLMRSRKLQRKQINTDARVEKRCRENEMETMKQTNGGNIP